MQSTAKLPVIGLDLAKSVFQLHIVDMDSGEIQRRQIKRAKLTDFFAKCQNSLVAMEAGASSHYWARTLISLGHQVKMFPAQHVKAFLLRDKTDAMDTQAIWVAAQQPHILPVPVKTERQQACLALHGMRRQLMKMRIMQTNALRGILAEFGIALPVWGTTNCSSRSTASWPRPSRLTCWRPTWWSAFRSSSNASMECKMTSSKLASGCAP
jgi:transposase